MTRVALLPRLNALGVASILETAGQTGPTPSASLDLLQGNSAFVSFAASGGSRSEKVATDLATGLRDIANQAGFPDRTDQAARSLFDQETTIYLAQQSELQTGESQRDDVWAFITTVLLPDIVSWRFPDQARHRYEGGVRNALQRLWVRGTALDRGTAGDERWELVRSLTEDAMVQIFERPSIGGSRPIALALAEGWVRTAAVIGRGEMEAVMRRASKLVRLKNEIVDLASLPSWELEKVVSDAFELACNVD